jgi:RND family efflux transporter MFP subunit
MPPQRNIAVLVATRVALCAGLLFVAGFIFSVLVWTKPQPAVGGDDGNARPVEVMHAVAVPVQRQWSGFGTAAAVDSADISAEVAGVVTSVPDVIEAGSAVRLGEVLTTLDAADFERYVDIITQQLADNEALLEQLVLEEASWSQRAELSAEETVIARRELERVEDAAAKQAAQPREVDRARTALFILERAETRVKEELAKIAPRRGALQARKLGLEAELELARHDVDRCTIRSPLDGVLADVDAEVGERVEIAHRVARVVDLSRMEVPLRLPASARPHVAVGDDVLLESQGAMLRSWEASVDRIGPEDDQTTRTMTVYVELEQDPAGTGLLVPGRFVQGTVVSSRIEHRTVVPRRSLIGNRVLLVEANVVRSRPVRVVCHVRGDYPQLGVESEQWAVLEEDLPAGSLVIVNAARTLPDGTAVDAVPPPRLQEAAVLVQPGKALVGVRR